MGRTVERYALSVAASKAPAAKFANCGYVESMVVNSVHFISKFSTNFFQDAYDSQVVSATRVRVCVSLCRR